MELNELTAISPVDGRYFGKAQELSKYFSESGLFQYRIKIEIEYFIALCEIPLPQLSKFNKNNFSFIRDIYKNFSLTDANSIKEIEKITNHDVKAVEYFLKQKFDSLKLSAFKEYLHFGLTSQDINNTATPLSLKESLNNVYLPLINEFISSLNKIEKEWNDISMLAHTHGQPASPTKLGKEIKVFSERITKQIEMLKLVPWSAKFGGATGNFNAHIAAYPEIDWVGFANKFVNQTLGLDRSQTTTQIGHYDNLAALFDSLRRINIILIDLSRDFWTYISKEYFKQRISKDEVGSSTMPHKVNPIDFENAEGNLGVANAIFEHLSSKLPISRLQRDLTDSTVLRNIGVPLAHTIIAIKSLQKGMSKVIVNNEVIEKDLEKNWAVIGEAIQSILRREGYPNPYETLKELTRTGKAITREMMSGFIDSLNISDAIKEELKRITPQNYTGIKIKN